MQQVAQDTYRLGGRDHSFYLIQEGGSVLIVDAGCSREWSKITSGLEKLGLSLDDVAGIVATHAHADHLGLAKRAQGQGLEVSVHQDERTRALGTYQGRFAVSPSELPIFNWHALRTFVPMIFAGVMKLDHLDEVSTFADGELLDLPGSPVVVHTPGHTEGHTMFHCPDRGLLFTGDGLVTMDLLGPGEGPQIMDSRFHLDVDLARQSLERLLDLEADLLLPGHGDPWRGTPAEAVAAAHNA